jgi:DNA-binding transcriptional ArsR family regulator
MLAFMQPPGDVFHAIADPNRRRLLDMLAAGDLPAQELAGHFGISFAAVSQHLKVLHEAGLVKRRAEGRQRIYSLTPSPLREVDDWTGAYRRFWQGRLKRLRSYLDDKAERSKAATTKKEKR